MVIIFYGYTHVKSAEAAAYVMRGSSWYLSDEEEYNHEVLSGQSLHIGEGV